METDALTKEEIIHATKVLTAAGADFVKSSTGFYTGGPCVGATEAVSFTHLKEDTIMSLKRILAGILSASLVLTVALSGCNNGQSGSADPSSSTRCV